MTEDNQKLLHQVLTSEAINPLDSILIEGVKLYQTIKGNSRDHLSAQDLKTHFNGTRDSLQFGDDYMGLLVQSSTADAFGRIGFKELLDQLANLAPAAALFTSRGMTLTIVAKSKGEFWVFDSHGENGQPVRLEKFKNVQSIIDMLSRTFAYNKEADQNANIEAQNYEEYFQGQINDFAAQIVFLKK